MLAKFMGEREDTNYQHMNIRSERGDITTNPADMQIIIRKCYKQFYAIKFKNIGKKGKFHETYKLVKFTQGKKKR